MTASRPLTQQAIRQFNSMVNRILMHQDRYRVAQDEIPAITILLEQRGLSKECAEWFTALKASGNTLAQACEQIGISPDDIALSKTLCMAFLDEHLREPLIATLADEVEFIHEFGLVKAYENLSNSSVFHLSARNLENDFPRWSLKNKSTFIEPIPCTAFVPLDFSLEGSADQTALRATLQPSQLARQVFIVLSNREHGLIDVSICINELKNLEAACRIHIELIQKTAREYLERLPLQGNETLRLHVMGDKSPSLTELSTKTLDMMHGMDTLNSLSDMKKTFDNLVFGALSNQEYFQRCFACDLEDALRVSVDDEYRDLQDEIKNGKETLAGFTYGFRLMREHGLPLDWILLRGACTLSAGNAQDVIGSEGAIKYLLHECEKLGPGDPMRHLGSVSAQYMLAGVLSHEPEVILQAVGTKEHQAKMLYDVSGDRRLLNAVRSEKLREEILAVDMGL